MTWRQFLCGGMLACLSVSLTQVVPAANPDIRTPSPEHAPIVSDVVVLIDARESMQAASTTGGPHNRLLLSREAAEIAIAMVPEGIGLSVIVLQDEIETLRPLLPLKPQDRADLSVRLARVEASGHGTLESAFTHVHTILKQTAPRNRPFLVLVTDGGDAQPGLTSAAAVKLRDSANGLRTALVLTQSSSAARTSLQRLAQAIHPDDNVEIVLAPSDISRALNPLRNAADEILMYYQHELAVLRSEFSEMQIQEAKRDTELRRLSNIEADRDALQRELEELTVAEAAQRKAATEQAALAKDLRDQKSAADTANADLRAEREENSRTIFTLQAQLKKASDDLTQTTSQLTSVTKARADLHGKVISDTEKIRTLESDFKAAQARAELLSSQIQNERDIHRRRTKTDADAVANAVATRVIEAVKKIFQDGTLWQWLTTWPGGLFTGGSGVLGFGLWRAFRTVHNEAMDRETKREERVTSLQELLGTIQERLDVQESAQTIKSNELSEQLGNVISEVSEVSSAVARADETMSRTVAGLDGEIQKSSTELQHAIELLGQTLTHQVQDADRAATQRSSHSAATVQQLFEAVRQQAAALNEQVLRELACTREGLEQSSAEFERAAAGRQDQLVSRINDAASNTDSGLSSEIQRAASELRHAIDSARETLSQQVSEFDRSVTQRDAQGAESARLQFEAHRQQAVAQHDLLLHELNRTGETLGQAIAELERAAGMRHGELDASVGRQASVVQDNVQQALNECRNSLSQLITQLSTSTTANSQRDKREHKRTRADLASLLNTLNRHARSLQSQIDDAAERTGNSVSEQSDRSVDAVSELTEENVRLREFVEGQTAIQNENIDRQTARIKAVVDALSSLRENRKRSAAKTLKLLKNVIQKINAFGKPLQPLANQLSELAS